MDYYIFLLEFFFGLGFFVLSIYFVIKQREKNRLSKLLSKPFDKKFIEYLKQTPHYMNLTKEDKEKIHKSIIIFANTKEFIGIDIEVTSEIKVIIAFYACLLLLHRTTKNCYDNLKTIIVYPSAVAYKNVHSSNGIYSNEQLLIDGQASNDVVIIVWHDAKKEAYHLHHDNVIVHEFAHEIDFMDGEIDGIPPMEHSKYASWTNVLFKDYKRLNKVILKNRDWGKYKLLGSYAGTNEAEFFAVVSERFFETPKSLKHHFPELYNELKDFYDIDTVKLV